MKKRLDVLWTAGEIGSFLRLGSDGVYALARQTDAPIYKAQGRLYAFESELEEWMRRAENRSTKQKPRAA